MTTGSLPIQSNVQIFDYLIIFYESGMEVCIPGLESVSEADRC